MLNDDFAEIISTMLSQMATCAASLTMRTGMFCLTCMCLGAQVLNESHVVVEYTSTMSCLDLSSASLDLFNRSHTVAAAAQPGYIWASDLHTLGGEPGFGSLRRSLFAPDWDRACDRAVPTAALQRPNVSYRTDGK